MSKAVKKNPEQSITRVKQVLSSSVSISIEKDEEVFPNEPVTNS